MTIGLEMDLLALKEIGRIVALARDEMIQKIKPGITTMELDIIGEVVLSKYGAKSAPKWEYNFPGATCISLNDVVAHGIPSSKVINEGDIVNIDVSAQLDGYFADTGATIPVGKVSLIKSNLIECSKIALNKAISKAKSGTKISQIGRTIDYKARKHGFTVIKNLAGNGIGRRLHEEPHDILNYYDKYDNRLLTNGIVLALESFISTGAEFVIEENDGWILRAPDKSFVARFEHTIIITKNEPIIITAV
jgi:methionyl aminopeptidase